MSPDLGLVAGIQNPELSELVGKRPGVLGWGQGAGWGLAGELEERVRACRWQRL